MKTNIFWFRRDLRLDDNFALNKALGSDLKVLPVFIFDTNITGDLPSDDARITFIHETLSAINNKLQKAGSSVYVLKGNPEEMVDHEFARQRALTVYKAGIKKRIL